MRHIEMQIDDLTYEVKEANRYKTQTVKTQIVLARSLRKDSYHINRLLHKDYGNSKKWNTYTISREGVVYQHFDNKFHSDFLGIKEADKQSISVVLENMGCLFQTPTGKHINWINEICEEDRVVEKKWFGYDFWEQFPEAQLVSTVLLCKQLCGEYNIPKICIDFHHYHKETVRFRGIVFRSNYVEDSSDINPLFNIEKFNEMIQNELI
jgi:N-acetyl-anhydromuramyl-L-alanine amidase AmpD